jgi:SAM-dependent methyltransferase
MLISGAADYSMPAHVLKAYRNVEAAVQVTVLDRCETPLYLCRWYAERMSVTMDTCACDILDFAPQDRFDVTCSHSFLARFPPRQRKDLMSAWQRILRPGGKVVTNARLNPSAPDDGTGFSPDQVTAFRDRVYREAVKHRDALGIDPDEIAEHARQYAKAWRTHSIRTPQEITGLFEDGGFDLDHLEVVETGGQLGAGKVGPSTAQKATYVEVVATRR